MLAMFNYLLNTALKYDVTAPQRLARLKGVVATIEWLPFHFVLQFKSTDDAIIVTQGETMPADIKLTGTPLQFGGLFLEDLDVQGDAAIGQAIVALLKDYHIDWETHLAPVIGDIPAYHAHRIWNRTQQALKKTRRRLTEMISEYIQEEACVMPSREALQDFYEEVDQLREATDRLEAQIK